MIFRRFFAVSAASLLYFALFCGTFAHNVFADVVHAYRKPSETDLQWLSAADSVPVPDMLGIVQVGFASSTNNALMPRRGPCSPAYVQIPIPAPSVPSVPPPPETADNGMTIGLAPEVDGVVNIAPIVIDSSTAIVQMTGERLPPPAEVPREESLVVPLATSAATPPLPLPVIGKHHGDASDHSTAHFGARRNNVDGGCDGRSGKPYSGKHRLHVPDMLGSSAWFTGYSVGTNDTTVVLPTMLLTQPNVTERFNASVQNRIWADYRHWNNAVSLNGKSRPVEQFSFGLEKQILRRTAVEVHVPIISQFASKQTADSFATSTELGNILVSVKQMLRQNSKWTVSGGIGVTLPTAEDYRLPIATARLKNSASSLVSFFGVQWHPNHDTFGHFIVQANLPIEKNELVFGDTRQKIEGQQVIRTGIQLGHWIYRMEHGELPCRWGAFAEVHYTAVMHGSPQYKPGDVFVSAVGSNQSTLTAAVGMPVVFGQLTCTNSLILPLSNHPFSVGYGFSLTRQF